MARRVTEEGRSFPMAGATSHSEGYSASSSVMSLVALGKRARIHVPSRSSIRYAIVVSSAIRFRRT